MPSSSVIKLVSTGPSLILRTKITPKVWRIQVDKLNEATALFWSLYGRDYSFSL